MRKPDDPTTASTDGGESFYGRWSRRKGRHRAAPAAPAPEPREPADGNAAGDAPAVPTGAVSAAEEAPRVLTDADMPPLESLGEDDDYSPFLSPGVSDALRGKALRKLFLSSKINVLDGLNDYDEDFTNFAPLGDVVTAEMRYRMEVEAERVRRRAEEEARALAERAPADAERRTDVAAARESGGDDDARQEVGTGQAPEVGPPTEAGRAGEAGAAQAQATGGDAHAGAASGPGPDRGVDSGTGGGRDA